MLAVDETLATGILDRLLLQCHVGNIDGRSFRLRPDGSPGNQPMTSQDRGTLDVLQVRDTGCPLTDVEALVRLMDSPTL